MEKVKYLIIGNGIAGLSAAKEIRNNDKQGTITMISSESYHTYYRVRLTECLSKDFKDEELLVNKDKWYEEKDIKVLLNKIVEKIDVDKSKVRLDDGIEIEYEKLLLATGSRPFIPPVAGKFKQGVLALRTLRDLKYIRSYFDNCNSITVIGGGLLGLEAAWSLKKLGKKINIVEFAPYLLPRQLDDEIGIKLEKKLKEESFNIYLSSAAEEILGENRANGILLRDGKKIETDGILFSVGIRPNLDIIRDTSIEFDKGIIVNKNLRTNIDNIYAAGDVIQIDGMVIGLWTSANEQGKVAGANMSGNALEYTEAKLFTSLSLGDIKLFSVGDIKDFDKVYEYKDENDGIHHKLFTTEGKLTGGILFGDTKSMGKLKKAVTENTDIDSYLDGNVQFK
ncbi:NAD(P)/FAD-dependent oxidoreductase [Clostridium sp. Cult1]|jgi:nitrite reductase (NADH) large subunit|uniref:NAD(P)/FAD-dependent oxidoreductase n=1 Tax=Clostridium sp. Cult1 TaxID=2079002 RepID=UPI001F1905A3|nr:FAD-dependent oxidoreductase [Clostridium sp. Cult1]MCF6462635.1 NAD(P)/FAD-dependent oxidoreductase [Clostridium sp. Cult1]